MRLRRFPARDPELLLDRLPALRTPHGVGLLDSASRGTWSLTGLATDALVLGGGGSALLAGPGREALSRALRPRRSPPSPVGGPLPPLTDGWLGMLGYGAGHLMDRIPPQGPTPLPTVGLLWMGAVAAYHHPSGELVTTSWGRRGPEDAPCDRAADALLDELEDRLLRSAPPAAAEDHPPEARGVLAPAPGPYLEAVERARWHIGEGDVFQLNLSRCFRAPAPRDPWAFYRQLRQRNPAPYAGYLEVEGGSLLSCSPELLVETRGRRVHACPIAGTAPRHPDPGRDRARIRAMRAHPKEQAEHVMLVDLVRNDLGRLCHPGTVVVPSLLGVESYTSVHHLVSRVEGRTRPEVGPLEVLRAVFPGGTITGAPKIRATELIHELEDGPRGAYTGSLGFVDGAGDATWNILIRSLVAAGGEASLRGGAGIVWDSDPERELAECEHKVRPFLDLLAGRSSGARRRGSSRPRDRAARS